MTPLVAACGDPGGAGALAPVLARLAREPDVQLDIYAYGTALDVLSSAGVQAMRAADAPARLNRDTIVVTATSAPNPVDLERRLIAMAHEAGCASAVQMDFWSHYANRFPRRADGAPCLPTRVFALDDAMAEGLREAGVPSDRIAITGHPGFDSLFHQANTFDAGAARQMRERHGIRAGERFVLFAAQPGYFDQPQAGFATLLEALEESGGPAGAPWALAVRPHPRDPSPCVPEREGVRVLVGAPGSAREAVLASDLVIGDTTMLLVESVLLGRPTLALRLDEREGESLPAFVPRVRNREALRIALASPAAATAVPPGPLADGRATERAVAEIRRLAGAGP